MYIIYTKYSKSLKQNSIYTSTFNMYNQEYKLEINQITNAYFYKTTFAFSRTILFAMRTMNYNINKCKIGTYLYIIIIYLLYFILIQGASK